MLTRWGVRLTVKPLLGTPSYRSKPSLSNAILKPIVHRINGDLYSWFQMLNLMAFLSSAMARQITDGNLIQLQTDGELSVGVGLFNSIGKKSLDNTSERSIATKFSLPRQ